MKRIFHNTNRICLFTIPAILFFTDVRVTAQSYLKKDAYNIGGSVSFGFTDTDNLEDERTTKDISVTPSFTYFFSNNFSLGFNFTLEYREDATRTVSTNTLVSKVINKYLIAGPTARYYFHTQNFAPFVETSVGYTNYLKSNDHGIAFTLGAGINYFLNKNIALEPHIIYILSKFFSPNYRINSYTFGMRIFYQIND